MLRCLMSGWGVEFGFPGRQTTFREPWNDRRGLRVRMRMGRKKGELSSLIREADTKSLYRVQMEFVHGGHIQFFRGTEIVADGRITSREFASFEKAMKWFLGEPTAQNAVPDRDSRSVA